MKVKYKIVAAFLFLSILLLVSLCTFVYINAAYQLKENFITKLTNRVVTVASVLNKFSEPHFEILSQVDSATTNTLFNEKINVFSKSETEIYHFSRNKAVIKNDIEIEKDLLNTVYKEGYIQRQINDRILVGQYFESNTNAIYVFVSAEDLNSKIVLKELLINLIVAFILGMIFAFFSGIYFSKKLLLPLTKLTSKVKNITASNLDTKLVESEIKDEWNDLCVTFNDLLSRLEESFAIQRRFVSNASHELSTPLTSVGNQIDVLLKNERTNEEYVKVFHSVRDDISHMTSLTQQLLQIATSSSGGGVQSDIFRIDEIVMDLPAYLKKIDQAYTVNIILDELPDNEKMCMVLCNNDLLFAALKNLAENGCKYSPNNLVNISFKFTPSRIIISFANICENLTQADLENIFQPFQRGKNARNINGYGLGLSLTRRLILLHKGEINANLTSPNELLIEVSLPNVTNL